MTDLRPLALYPYPVTEADLEAIKAAKAALNLPYRVVPVQAVPGGPVRVLALRSGPPFLCDFRGTADPLTDADLPAKLAWVLGEIEHDPKASLLADQLLTGPLHAREIEYVEPELTDDEILHPKPKRRYDPND